MTAYEVVHAVATRDAYANLALTAELRQRSLSGRDAAFATELTHGTLRRLGGYDEILSRCVDRPLAKLDSEVLAVLRLGVHQLLGMRVPPHAAVATTVDLARSVAGIGPSKFVNAVLRKVGACDLDGWLSVIAPSEKDDPVGHLAAVHFHPRWIVSAFAEALGGSHALEETATLLEADNIPARVTLAAWPGRSTVDELREVRPDSVSAGRYSPFSAVLEEGDPGLIPAVAEGRAGVQDEGSQLVAGALANAALEGRDTRWLDLCAGPGGKSALLSGLARLQGARLLASELQPHRAALVAKNLDSSGLAICADGTAPAWHDSAFDRVLADVPCTGLGALRRRPEARWRRKESDIRELQGLQIALLGSALDSVRIGGLVAYVTCSPVVAETRGVIDAVLSTRNDVELVDARPYLEGVPDLGDGPDIQLWPHRHGTDAMYLALLTRS